MTPGEELGWGKNTKSGIDSKLGHRIPQQGLEGESVERGKSWQRSRGSPGQEREKGPGEMQRVVSCGKQRKPQKESLGRNT